MDIRPFINIIKPHSEPISSLAFTNYTSANENILLASASNDKTVNIYNISNSEKNYSLSFSYKYHLMGINKITFNYNNTLLLSGGNDFQLNVLDLNNQSLLRNFRTNSVITSIDINYSSNIIAVGTYDNSILLFDLRSRNLIVKMISHSEPITCVKFSNDSTVVFSTSYDSFCRVWDIFKFNCLKTINLENSPALNSINLLPNENYILLSAFNDNLEIMDIVKEEEIKKFIGCTHKNYLIDTCLYKNTKNDKYYILTGDEEGNFCSWDVKEKNSICKKINICDFKEEENSNLITNVMNAYNDNYNSDNNLIAYSVYGESSHSIFIVKENNLNEDIEMNN